MKTIVYENQMAYKNPERNDIFSQICFILIIQYITAIAHYLVFLSSDDAKLLLYFKKLSNIFNTGVYRMIVYFCN